MSLILTKIQFLKTAATEFDLVSGELPYYEKDGKLFLKETNEEIEIIEEKEILL